MLSSEVSSRRSSMATVEVQSRSTLNIPTASKLSARRKSIGLYQRSLPGHSEQPHPMELKIANTYQLAPEESKRFRCKDVKDAIDYVLESRLSGLRYDAEKCRILLPLIADEIKDRVKVLGYERFKLVCIVTMGKMNNQGIRVASRCLWNTAQDRMATASFCNEDLFASVSVFGIYQE